LVAGETGAKAYQLSLPGRVTAVGLELPETLSFEEWSDLGGNLRGVSKSVMWWIGDWLCYGERQYGEMYAQAMQETGRSYDGLRQAKLVAERIKSDRRRSNLSFGHHAEVAFRDDADELLDKAEREEWSRQELRTEVSRRKSAVAIAAPHANDDTCGTADLDRVIAAGLRFGTIYADPPWLYDNQATRASTGNHYSGMTVKELCELPVQQLAADASHLHLWTTNAFLFECPKILDAWGFEFRSTFIWCKSQMGIGNYWRNSHEILLTAIRGDAKRFNDHSMMSWLETRRGKHSAKPEQVRHMIERASPGPRLELFGRSPANGWMVWGNQVEKNLFSQSMAMVDA
jgi:N6-adenosine-specific RNA methylase IME4